MKISAVAIIEVILVITCLVFGALWWVFPEQHYEPPFAVSAFLLVVIDLRRRYANRSRKIEINKKDLELCENLIKLFPIDIIRFYKEHDFLASAERKFISPLFAFVETWDNSEHEFVDEELEEARKLLYDAASSLGVAIAKNTVPNRNGELSVKPDNLPFGPTPQWIIDDAREINVLVPSFVDRFDNVVRLGRRKLYTR